MIQCYETNKRYVGDLTLALPLSSHGSLRTCRCDGIAGRMPPCIMQPQLAAAGVGVSGSLKWNPSGQMKHGVAATSMREVIFLVKHRASRTTTATHVIVASWPHSNLETRAHKMSALIRQAGQRLLKNPTVLARGGQSVRGFASGDCHHPSPSRGRHVGQESLRFPR